MSRKLFEEVDGMRYMMRVIEYTNGEQSLPPFLMKDYPVDYSFITTGDGYWGMEAGQAGRYTNLRLKVMIDNDGSVPGYAELQAFHNLAAEGPEQRGQLLNPGYGPLLYTDSGAEKAAGEAASKILELRKLNIHDISGSEQGMQGRDYLSLDCRVDTTYEQLIELGFQDSLPNRSGG